MCERETATQGCCHNPHPTTGKETTMKLHGRTVMRETADLDAQQLRFILCYLMPYLEQGRTFDEAQEILMTAIENEKSAA